MLNNYYTPKLEDFILGFTCETCYSWFSPTGEWVKLEVDQNFMDKGYLALIKSDAYETEFRVKIN